MEMSWFDTSGLASLAKNALKEAQKQIDKALDIQDEQMTSSSMQTEQKCKTEPTTPLQPLWPTNNPAVWGSFTGSFFDNPKADEMVTTPPKGGFLSGDQSTMKRQSVHSNSDSVEILSPPTTPCSGVTSPSVTVYNSESVEIITTPTSSELLSPKSPDSVDVISCDEILEEDDDSMSFNTVMDDPIDPAIVVTIPPSKTSNSTPSEQNLNVSDVTDSFESVKTYVEATSSLKGNTTLLEDNLIDSQTLLSDSTQSFEDIQIPDPASEEKDIVKVGSGPPSEHTSADEVDTTTSSDIEIISNPNGDSSSTNSACRASPLKTQICTSKKWSVSNDLKMNKKGHCREPSEVSTHSDDSQLSSHSETDKLLRRISELSEILESREIRLTEIERMNAELLERNTEFQAVLEAGQKKSDHIETEEYTQRLSALEKKFQMSIRERDALRDQLKVVWNDLSTKIPKEVLDKTVVEKDFMIKELREEGEKLSKQVLNHSNIIKKLRSKEKENDTVLKRNKEQIAELAEEVERMKKSLAAKEEVERSQIDAVHKLSSEKRKLEKENLSMKGQLEDLNLKLETMQTSLVAAKKELQEKQASHGELVRKAQAFQSLESEKKITQDQNAEILVQLEDFREKLRVAETENSIREHKLRQENLVLLRSLESAERRAEELTQELSLATIPLVRQLEALQGTLSTRISSWEKQEKQLLAELEEAQNKLRSFETLEVSSVEQQNLLNSRIRSLEERLSSALLKSEQLSNSLQQNDLDFNLKEAEYKRQIEELTSKLSDSLEQIEQYREKFAALEKSMELERALCRKEKNDERSAFDCSQGSTTLEAAETGLENEVENNSPTLSLGRNSLADSFGSSAWQMDDLDCISNSGRHPAPCGSAYGLNVGLGQMGHTTSMLENLQSSLKQREGEVSQLQWELSRLQAERNFLNSEISNLTIELENIKDKLAMHETLEKEFTDLQRQYDALLQMYGEKVEETQELELDLQDVKEMYKAQIDELLRQKSLS